MYDRLCCTFGGELLQQRNTLQCCAITFFEFESPAEAAMSAICTAAQQLFNKQLPAGPLQMKTLCNADISEVSLEVVGCTVLRFAAAYGFRNIQTLRRKVKR